MEPRETNERAKGISSSVYMFGLYSSSVYVRFKVLLRVRFKNNREGYCHSENLMALRGLRTVLTGYRAMATSTTAELGKVEGVITAKLTAK